MEFDLWSKTVADQPGTPQNHIGLRRTWSIFRLFSGSMGPSGQGEGMYQLEEILNWAGPDCMFTIVHLRFSR